MIAPELPIGSVDIGFGIGIGHLVAARTMGVADGILLFVTATPRSRVRWTTQIEVLWWIESVVAVAFIPTPGIGAGLAASVLLVPVLISHVRHGRTLGRIGYWYSVAVVIAQVAVVLLLPTSGSAFEPWQWLAWVVGGVVALSIGVSAFFASEPSSST